MDGNPFPVNVLLCWFLCESLAAGSMQGCRLASHQGYRAGGRPELLFLKRRGLSSSVFLLKLPSEHWVMPLLCDGRSLPLSSSSSLQGQGHLVPGAVTWIAEALSSGISFPGAPVWSVQDTFSLWF